MLNMDSGHIVDQTTKEVKVQTVEVNNLFEIKMTTPGASSSMNKAADSITSGHASGSVTAETWHHQMRHLDYNNLKCLVKAADEIHLTDINLSNSSSYKFLECESCRQIFVKQKLFDQIS